MPAPTPLDAAGPGAAEKDKPKPGSVFRLSPTVGLMPPQTPLQPGAERWLSKKNVADYYDLGVRTIERWVYDGCKSRMLGGVRRFRLSEVEAFLAAREVER
jgi:hypothetical protein